MPKRLLIGSVLMAATLGAGCRQQNSCGIVNSPQWGSLVQQMNLPSYKVQRLTTYAQTIEGSCGILASADTSTRATAQAALDREMSRALPLLVPAEHVGKVQSYFHDVLRQR